MRYTSSPPFLGTHRVFLFIFRQTVFLTSFISKNDPFC